MMARGEATGLNGNVQCASWQVLAAYGNLSVSIRRTAIQMTLASTETSFFDLDSAPFGLTTPFEKGKWFFRSVRPLSRVPHFSTDPCRSNHRRSQRR